MFTFLKPIKSKIKGSEHEDFYLTPGEPIGLRYWCPMGVKAFFGVDIPIGEQVRVWIMAGVVNE